MTEVEQSPGERGKNSVKLTPNQAAVFEALRNNPGDKLSQLFDKIARAEKTQPPSKAAQQQMLRAVKIQLEAQISATVRGEKDGKESRYTLVSEDSSTHLEGIEVIIFDARFMRHKSTQEEPTPEVQPQPQKKEMQSQEDPEPLLSPIDIFVREFVGRGVAYNLAALDDAIIAAGLIAPEEFMEARWAYRKYETELRKQQTEGEIITIEPAHSYGTRVGTYKFVGPKKPPEKIE